MNLPYIILQIMSSPKIIFMSLSYYDIGRKTKDLDFLFLPQGLLGSSRAIPAIISKDCWFPSEVLASFSTFLPAREGREWAFPDTAGRRCPE